MGRWVCLIGVAVVTLFPFALRTEEKSPWDNETLFILSTNTQKDFSTILGNEAFVKDVYNFFERFTDILSELETKASQLIALYPEEPISLSWEKDMQVLRNFLANRETNIQLMSFIGLGIYPDRAYKDNQTRIQFRELQTLIFFGLLKEMEAYYTYEEGEIDEETLHHCLAEVESEIMTKIKELCFKSRDPFLRYAVPEFLGNASSRFDVLKQILPIDNETEFNGNTQAEIAFEHFTEEFINQLDELIDQMVSLGIFEELSQKMINEVEDSVSVFPLQEWQMRN